MKEIFLTNRHFADLNPLLIGRQVCSAAHAFGPAIRKYTLLHYVERGMGTLYKDGQAYPVQAGEVFVILPNEVTYYRADATDPWVYRWIGFDGTISEKYREASPVFAMEDRLFPNVLHYENARGGIEYALTGQLFAMTAALFGETSENDDRVSRIKNYIKASYMLEIHVEEIAAHFSLDRRYLSRLFKKKTGKTLQEYLIAVRMREACRQLSLGRGVAETAGLCGYADACNFSKMFKREIGMSPAAWRIASASRDEK